MSFKRINFRKYFAKRIRSLAKKLTNLANSLEPLANNVYIATEQSEASYTLKIPEDSNVTAEEVRNAISGKPVIVITTDENGKTIFHG